MPSIKEVKTFPFTEKHLRKFRKELDQAGSFDNLMLKKEAMKERNGIRFICLVSDIENYKRKHLKGSYASLSSMYDTEMPYVFWSNLYEILLESEEHEL